MNREALGAVAELPGSLLAVSGKARSNCHTGWAQTLSVSTLDSALEHAGSRCRQQPQVRNPEMI
jgi:hypothetical protein